MHVDGSTHSKGTGIGIVLQNIHGDKIEKTIKCGFKATNNEVEYEALIAGLKLALSLGIVSLIVRSDSQLVSKQVGKSYQTKDDRMKKYLGIVERLVDKFENFEIKQISREDNQQADALANLGSTLETNQDKHISLYFLTTSALESQVK